MKVLDLTRDGAAADAPREPARLTWVHRDGDHAMTREVVEVKLRKVTLEKGSYKLLRGLSHRIRLGRLLLPKRVFVVTLAWDRAYHMSFPKDVETARAHQCDLAPGRCIDYGLLLPAGVDVWSARQVKGGLAVSVLLYVVPHRWRKAGRVVGAAAPALRILGEGLSIPLDGGVSGAAVGEVMSRTGDAVGASLRALPEGRLGLLLVNIGDGEGACPALNVPWRVPARDPEAQAHVATIELQVNARPPAVA